MLLLWVSGTIILTSGIAGVSTESDADGTPKFVRRYERKGARATFLVMVKRGCAIIVYLLLGALAFNQIEGRSSDDRDATSRHELSTLRLRLHASNNVSTAMLDAFEELVARNIQEKTNREKKWDYYQSLYFASTVTTTIGYGHITPQTQGGRLFLITFALVGIPLNILALASVGEHITIMIFYMLQWMTRRMFGRRRRVIANISIKVMLISMAMMCCMLFLGGCLYEATEEWTYIDSMYYCFVALATIGFGDMVPNSGEAPDTGSEKALWFIKVMYISIGLSLVSTVFTALSNAMEEKQQISTCCRSRGHGDLAEKPASYVMEETDGQNGREDDIKLRTAEGKQRETAQRTRKKGRVQGCSVRFSDMDDPANQQLVPATNPPVIVINHPLTGKPLTYVMAPIQEQQDIATVADDVSGGGKGCAHDNKESDKDIRRRGPPWLVAWNRCRKTQRAKTPTCTASKLKTTKHVAKKKYTPDYERKDPDGADRGNADKA